MILQYSLNCVYYLLVHYNSTKTDKTNPVKVDICFTSCFFYIYRVLFIYWNHYLYWVHVSDLCSAYHSVAGYKSTIIRSMLLILANIPRLLDTTECHLLSVSCCLERYCVSATVCLEVSTI